MKNCFLCLLLFLSVLSFAQETKEINIKRLNGSPPKIDGLLNDNCWQTAAVADNFTQFEPYNGIAPSQQTKVYLTYDDEALYVGAMMYDTAIDSLYTTLGKRDVGGNLNADLFTILIGPFNDGINMVEFMVSASGVQSDAKHTGNRGDINWNAVWESEVGIQDDAWIAEYKIPYSALRFPKKDIQEWGFLIFRHIRRHREWDSWSFVDANINGFVNQAGVLKGIENIQPPLRLSFMPYVSGYVEKNDESSKWGTKFNGGMDVKLGLNESFTLDMTLIPDFGQVQSDDQVLNLSPFEVHYNENRPFFTEGTELFNKGGIFYSRRVGGRPDNFIELADTQRYVSEPLETKMINATKFSGRTKHGLGIGVFNAVVDRAVAEVEDTIRYMENGVEKWETQRYDMEIQGVTNYNMFVFDQNLKNNSYISLVNSNVSKFNNDYMANVSGTEFSLNNKEKSYNLRGKYIHSQIYSEEDKFGHAYFLELSKTSGKFLFELTHNVESDTYDINDFGFLRSNNEFTNSAEFSYRQIEPKGAFRNYWIEVELQHSSLYKPRKFNEFMIDFMMNGTLNKSYVHMGMYSFVVPFESHDFYEAREDGREFIQEQMYMANFWMSTDYRKKFAISSNAGGWNRFSDNEKGRWFNISPRFAPNDKLLFIYRLSFDFDKDNRGYVTREYDDNDNLQNIVFGRRDVRTISNRIQASYMFSNKSSLNFRLRHYWRQVEYSDFFYLKEDGYLDASLGHSYFGEEKDIDVNIFNIDFTYTWNFAPGSELSIVWKNAIYSEKEDIRTYSKNIRRTFDSPQTNSISVKALYYLDYQHVKRWFR